MKLNLNKEKVKSNLNALFNSKTENQLIERDALMLQASYLSEIERLTKEKGINRKEIALKINTSPSYLTQVFRGDKPLNFVTLAKIKRALNLKFEVKASFKSEQRTNVIAELNLLSSNLTKPSTTLTSSFGDGYSDKQMKEIEYASMTFSRFDNKSKKEIV